MRRKRLTLKFQFSIFIIALFAVIFILFAFVFYKYMKKSIVERNKEMITNQLTDFVDFFDLLQSENQNNVEDKLKAAHYIFYNEYSGIIQEDKNTKLKIEATHFLSQKKYSIEVNKWSIDNIPLHNDFAIVDKMQMLGVNLAVFQKTELGYVNISSAISGTNIRKAMWLLVDNTLPHLETIEKNETTYGRAYIVDDWYFAAYEPIVIDNKVAGFLCVIIPEKNLDILKEKFYAKKVLESGYPFILSNCEIDKGEMIINPYSEGENWKTTDDPEKRHIYEYIQQNLVESKNTVAYQENNEASFYFETKFKDETYAFDCTYYEQYRYFICITNSVYEYVDKPLHRLRMLLFIGGLIAMGIVEFLVFKYVKFSLRSIETLIGTIKKMSQGQEVQSIEVVCNQEISLITESLNVLSAGLSQSAKFAEAIGKQNFNYNYLPLSENNVLGNSLLKMRSDLVEFAKIREENSWLQEAVVKISNMLSGDKTPQDISNQLIKCIANILNCQVAAMYLTNDENILVLSGSYAFNIRKSNTNEFRLGEGLIGQAALEQKIILYKSAPKDYIIIQSGLGETEPTNILIVPFVFNAKVMGVAEFATTYEITDRHFALLNRVSENIAVTINTINANLRTKILLEQTLSQSEELRTQQKELRAINESLSEQSQQLEESHEELASLNENMKKHQEELQFETDKLTLITENVPAMLAYISIDGEFLYVNDFYAKVFNRSRQQIEGQQIEDLLKGEELTNAHQILKDIQKGKPIYMENRRIINGTINYISMNFVPQKDLQTGKVKAILIMILDITETKKTEEKIRKNEERLRAVIDSAAAGVGIVQSDGLFSEVNQTLCDMLGYSHEEMMQLKYLDLLHPEDRISSEIGIKLFFQGNSPFAQETRNKIINQTNGSNVPQLNSKNIERRYLKKDGTIVWASLSPSPLKNENGETDALVGVIIDITSRVKAEQEVKSINDQLFTQNEEIANQKEILETKNKAITDSINYAQRIQKAVIRPDKLLNAEKIFIMLKPKDIVSGDFFYIKELEDYTYLAAVDCTGHGVPGALMSILGISFLNEIVRKRIYKAADVLDELRRRVKVSLGQTGKFDEAKDGMDIALCVINNTNQQMTYAGAHNPLYMVRNNELSEIKATKNPIGIYLKEIPFENHEIQLIENDTFYLFSDGYVDQTGENNEKLKSKRFKEILLNINQLTMPQQMSQLEDELLKWQGHREQIDDILVIGYKVIPQTNT